MNGLYLLMTIVRRTDAAEYEAFFRSNGISVTYSANCNGTAHAKTLALLGIEKRERIEELPPKAVISKGVLTPREAVLSPSEVISVNDARGRILADITVGCPPAVPIIVSGEVVDEDAISAFLYYGIEKIKVAKQ